MNPQDERKMVESELPAGYTLRQLYDQIKTAYNRSKIEGEEEVTFSVPSYTEIAISVELAELVIMENQQRGI